MVSWWGPVTDLLMVFLMELITLSTALILAWCIGRVTLNSMVSNFRLEITFISVLIKFLPAFTMFNPESIQMSVQMFFWNLLWCSERCSCGGFLGAPRIWRFKAQQESISWVDIHLGELLLGQWCLPNNKRRVVGWSWGLQGWRPQLWRMVSCSVWWSQGTISSCLWSFCRLLVWRTWTVCVRVPGGHPCHVIVQGVHCLWCILPIWISCKWVGLQYEIGNCDLRRRRDWTTRCLILLVSMMVSVALAKHLISEDEMEVLTVFQVTASVGLALQALQALWMKVRAFTTFEKLWLCSRRLMIRSWDGLTGIVAMMLTDLVGVSQAGRVLWAKLIFPEVGNCHAGRIWSWSGYNWCQIW